MPRRSKISSEEKIRITEEYLSGRLSSADFEQRYKLKNQRLYDWVRLYQTRGAEGLMPCKANRKYAPEMKRLAVGEYLSGTESLNELCAKYDISSHSTLQGWIKRHNSHGDFEQPNNGVGVCMAKGRKTTLEERIGIVRDLIACNKDYGKTIERHGVSYQQIYGWVRKYERDGIAGLADRRGKRRGEDSMSEPEKLRARLKLKEAENLRLRMENDLLKKLEELERGRGMNQA
jgi:transposase-like protein